MVKYQIKKLQEVYFVFVQVNSGKGYKTGNEACPLEEPLHTPKSLRMQDQLLLNQLHSSLTLKSLKHPQLLE